MAVKFRSYAVANTVLTVQQVVAWLMIIGATIGFFNVIGSMGHSGNSQFAVLEITIRVAMVFSSLGTIIGGLMLLAFVQGARANIHSAEMNWEMLEMMRKSHAQPSIIQPLSILSTGNASSGVILMSYKGHQIRKDGSSLLVDGNVFQSTLDAQNYIDGLI